MTILPDGRLYVFGLTRPLLEVLASVPSREGCLQVLLEQVQQSPAAADGQETARE